VVIIVVVPKREIQPDAGGESREANEKRADPEPGAGRLYRRHRNRLRRF
jgi:hypothetical protein